MTQPISWDFFLEINILSAISGNLFVTAASTMAEKDIDRLSKQDLKRGGLRLGIPLLTLL